MDDDMEVMEGIEENVASPDPTLTASQQTTKKSLKLSYEEYRTMANLIVHYLRKKDAEDIRKNDLVAWYIEETLGGDIESQVKIEIMILTTLRNGILFPKMFWPIQGPLKKWTEHSQELHFLKIHIYIVGGLLLHSGAGWGLIF